MKTIFYLKLALTNIKKNLKFYMPYLFTATYTVMMFYLFNFLAGNEGIEAMGPTTAAGLRSIFRFGTIVIAVFSIIFLFYTNSFVIKRRKKELGLFNVLGLEKRHLSLLMLIENLMISLTSTISGILLGILFSKLMLLFLYNLVHIQAEFGFAISKKGITSSLILFGIIFGINLIYDFIQISLTKPVNLLTGSNAGEKEPKTKWILTIIGSGCMIAGYILANTISSPLEALSIFFIAVLLVIAGTYLLFIAVSITILKMLKKNKWFYYQSDRFISVSGMLYRMKQNAAGLASICILSTMVIIMVSTTVCMYVGSDDLLKNRFPNDIMIDVYDPVDRELPAIEKLVNNQAKEMGLKVTMSEYNSQLMLLIDDSTGEVLPFYGTSKAASSAGMASVISLETYQKFCPGFDGKLSDNEIFVCSSKKVKLSNSLNMLGETYPIKEKVKKSDFNKSNYYVNLFDMYVIVVKDDAAVLDIQSKYQELIEQKKAEKGAEEVYVNDAEFYGGVNMDVDGSAAEKVELYKNLTQALSRKIEIVQKDQTTVYKEPSVSIACREESRQDFEVSYGGLLFLGIFLGITFLVATVLIIYYKQITEGYDDQKRFLIMQQVGMSKEEVKKTIKSQVMLVFFLPLAAAVCHIAGSFKMIEKLLNLLNLTNVTLFVAYTVVTVVGFALFYVVIYTLTARVYYRIVKAA